MCNVLSGSDYLFSLLSLDFGSLSASLSSCRVAPICRLFLHAVLCSAESSELEKSIWNFFRLVALKLPMLEVSLRGYSLV